MHVLLGKLASAALRNTGATLFTSTFHLPPTAGLQGDSTVPSTVVLCKAVLLARFCFCYEVHSHAKCFYTILRCL